MDAPTISRPGRRLALFDQGFRPFFLIAGLVATVVILAWVAALHGASLPDGPLPLPLWHAHEMLAGFVGAAMTGFLLTAIPNWLGRAGYGGAPLALAAAAFLAARAALAPGSPVPLGTAAILDLLPIPLVLLWCAPALIRSGRLRILGPPALVLVFWVADLLMLGHAAGWWQADTWDTGKLLALDLGVLLVGLIGGRIVPSFTLNALRKRGAAPTPSPAFPRADEAANIALVGVVAADLIAPGGPIAGGIAGLAAVLCALRLSRWYGWQVASDPLLLVLHGAWAFLPLGLAVKAAALLGGPAWLAGAWLHLLGAGALGLMVMAVMTRASLGHTGRPLRAGPAMATAFVLVAAAALLRGFGPALLSPMAAYGLAGAAWVAGYGLFLCRFAPILLTKPVNEA